MSAADLERAQADVKVWQALNALMSMLGELATQVAVLQMTTDALIATHPDARAFLEAHADSLTAALDRAAPARVIAMAQMHHEGLLKALRPG